MKKVLFPGSFDPITNAHLNIIKRAIELGFYVEVGILNNREKSGMLSVEKKLEIINKIKENHQLNNMNVFASNDLLVDVCDQRNISLVIRGIRSIKDYEYEKELEFNNKKLNNKLEYIYMNTQDDLRSVSSTIVRELIYYKRDVSHLVPKEVVDSL